MQQPPPKSIFDVPAAPTTFTFPMSHGVTSYAQPWPPGMHNVNTLLPTNTHHQPTSKEKTQSRFEMMYRKN